jgi:hypothetical protein
LELVVHLDIDLEAFDLAYLEEHLVVCIVVEAFLELELGIDLVVVDMT